MADGFDPYKILGVERTASLDQIEAAYRQKVLKYHPDRGGDAWAFQQVQEAYEQITRVRRAGNADPTPGTRSATAQTLHPNRPNQDRSGSTAGSNSPKQEAGPAAAQQSSRSNQRRASTDDAARKAQGGKRGPSAAYSAKFGAVQQSEQRRATAWFVGTTTVLVLIVITFVFTRSRRPSVETLAGRTPQPNAPASSRGVEQEPLRDLDSARSPQCHITVSNASRISHPDGSVRVSADYRLDDGSVAPRHLCFWVLVGVGRRMEHAIQANEWRETGTFSSESLDGSTAGPYETFVEEELGTTRSRISNILLVDEFSYPAVSSGATRSQGADRKADTAQQFAIRPSTGEDGTPDSRVTPTDLTAPRADRTTSETDALIARLATAPEASERSEILRRLTRVAAVDRTAAINAVTEALDDLAPSVRDCALNCLRGFGPEAETAVPALIAVFRTQPSESKRQEILQAIGDINDDSSEGISILIEVARGASSGKARIQSKRYGVAERMTAITVLGRLGPRAEKAVPVILDILKLSALDLEHSLEPFHKSADALARIGVSGKGVASTLRQFREGKGIRPPKPNLVEQGKVIADTALKTLDQGRSREAQ